VLATFLKAVLYDAFILKCSTTQNGNHDPAEEQVTQEERKAKKHGRVHIQSDSSVTSCENCLHYQENGVTSMIMYIQIPIIVQHSIRKTQ